MTGMHHHCNIDIPLDFLLIDYTKLPISSGLMFASIGQKVGAAPTLQKGSFLRSQEMQEECNYNTRKKQNLSSPEHGD